MRTRLSIGFTGTRMGMRYKQAATLQRELRKLSIPAEGVEAHHGMCVGADEEFEWIVRRVLPSAFIHAHPCDLADPKFRSTKCRPNKTSEPAPPLARNKTIVDKSHIIFATPDSTEQPRGGTWSTIRYAQQRGKIMVVIMPDGSIAEEVNA